MSLKDLPEPALTPVFEQLNPHGASQGKATSIGLASKRSLKVGITGSNMPEHASRDIHWDPFLFRGSRSSMILSVQDIAVQSQALIIVKKSNKVLDSVDGLDEFLDYVMIEAAKMKGFDEFSRVSFNVCARSVIEHSGAAPLIRFFSYSLEDRIFPRHEVLVVNGVNFKLRYMLASTDKEFDQRVAAAVERRQRFESGFIHDDLSDSKTTNGCVLDETSTHSSGNEKIFPVVKPMTA